MMPTNGPVGVCLGTSPNHQTPPQQQQPGQSGGVQQPQGPNGPPRNGAEGLLMTANAPQNGSGSSGGFYGMEVPQAQQPLNVHPGGGAGPTAASTSTSPTGGPDPSNAIGNGVGGGLLGQSQAQAVAGPPNGYMSQQPPQPNNAAAQNNYSTTGQGTWTGSNTLTYTQAMQPDMQRQQGNYCE